MYYDQIKLLKQGVEKARGLLGDAIDVVPGLGTVNQGLLAAENIGRGNLAGAAENIQNLVPTGKIAGRAIKALTKGRGQSELGGLLSAKAPRQDALDLAQKRAALPVSEGGLGLPPDNTPMQRAEAMKSSRAYHGTTGDYDAIDLDRAGKASGGNVRAFFTAKDDPVIANDYIPMELIPNKPYANVYRNQQRYDNALFNKYKEFQSQPDLFLTKPDFSRPEMLRSALNYGQDKTLQQALNNFVGNPDFIANANRNKALVSRLLDDQNLSKPRMHTEQPVEGSNIIPMRVRDSDFVEYDAQMKPWSPLLDQSIQAYLREIDAKPAGVNIKNVVDSETGRLGTTQMIFDPSRVRSEFAAFDPFRMNENDLLAIQGGLLGTSQDSSILNRYETDADRRMEIARRNAALPVDQGGLGLPEDNTPMDRAKAMGFDVDNPLYHGTGADIQAFDPSQLGTNTRADGDEVGIFMSGKPDLASQYADIAARGGWYGRRQPGQANVIPLVSRAQNPKQYETASGFYRDADAAAAQRALGEMRAGLQSQGYDSIQVRPDREEVVMFDPSMLRSRFAAFDPFRRNESDLLALQGGQYKPQDLLGFERMLGPLGE